jgi:hypothetical protein
VVCQVTNLEAIEGEFNEAIRGEGKFISPDATEFKPLTKKTLLEKGRVADEFELSLSYLAGCVDAKLEHSRKLNQAKKVAERDGKSFLRRGIGFSTSTTGWTSKLSISRSRQKAVCNS